MKINLALLVLAVTLARSLTGFAATAAGASRPDPATATPNAFFGPTNLFTIHLTIPADQWEIMEQDVAAPVSAVPPGGNNGPARLQPLPAFGPGGMPPGRTHEFNNGTAQMDFEGQPFGAIRVRFKGNSSFRFAGSSLKRSLKLDFNDLDKSRTFFGLTKLNLNNNAMDPSQLREALAYDIFRQGGVPAGRTAFVRVFLTVPGKFTKACAGLFTAVEQVDERFLKERFGSKHGLLMKPESFAGFPFLGNDWSPYTNHLQLKTEPGPDDPKRLIAFVKTLNLADDSQFQATLPGYVDVEEFLRFLALQSLLANLDSPLMTPHNFYLFLPPKSQKLLWIPWDLNEAFGAFGPGGSSDEQMNLSLDKPFTRANRLAERILQAPATKEHYHEILRGLLATNFNAARLFPLVDSMAATIRPALAGDPMVSSAQFEAAISDSTQPVLSSAGNAGRPGFGGPGGMTRARAALKLFITRRCASALRQLDDKASGYVPREMGPRGGPGRGGPLPPGGFR